MTYKRKASYSRSSSKRRKTTVRRTRRAAYRRKAPRNGGRVNFNKRVLQVIKKTAEPKFIHNNITGFSTLKHNSFNDVKIWNRAGNHDTFPLQGDNQGMRNGNEIYGKGFMLRGSFNFAGDRQSS